MDYKELISALRNNNVENNCHDCALGYYAFEAATAITDLLARAEAAEARAEKAKKCIEEVNTAILLKSKTEALNAIKRWHGQKGK